MPGKSSTHGRWNDGQILSSHGYVKVRVGPEHPLADPNGYAYEHLLVWVSAGNARQAAGWVLHHRNETKTDNRLSNLELKRRSDHSVEHSSTVSDAQVRLIRETYARGEADTTALASAFDVRPQTVWKIIKGFTRASAGGPIQTGSLRGKRAAGRALDGVTHDAMPEARP
jgi:hypothetical protein